MPSFGLQLLERGGVDAARPEIGRFRACLLGAFANALKADARAAPALKRGGGRLPFPLDAANGAIGVADAADGPEQRAKGQVFDALAPP